MQLPRLAPLTIALVTALATGVVSTPLLAADTGSQANLDPVIVTATRTEQDIKQSLASATLITAADIERLQPRDILDVLSAQAGIAVANSGGEGKLSTIFMRGTSSDHVLVLVNGVRFGSPTAGIAAIQDIPVDQVERIEIVRGPRAALYGSDALGGVIHIFTRDIDRDVQFNAHVTGGSYGRQEAGVGVGQRGENAWYRVDAGHVETDGFDACENSLTSGCFADEPDDDGYDNTSVSGRIGYAFNDASELELEAWQARGENHYDGYFNYTEYLRDSYSLRSKTAITSNWNLHLRAGRSSDDSENSGPFETSTLDTERDEFSLQSDTHFDTTVLTLGTDFRDDKVEGDTAYDETSRQTKAVFGQMQYGIGAGTTETAVRYTDDEQFGDKVTGSFAIGYPLGESWRTTLSYGTAFNAPTFNDLYFPGFSNPELEPETSRSTEIGFRYTDNFQLDINLYENRLDNLIEFDFATSMPVNVSSARIRGLELRWQMNLDAWTLSANATLLDTENQSDANNGNELPRRPDQSLRIDADRQFGAFSLGMSAIAESRRYDNLDNSVELAGYGLFDLRGSWDINEEWQLAARIGNLLDRDYQTVAGYHQAGRNGQLTLRYRY